MSSVIAKFEVTKSAELGYGGKRSDIQRLKKYVPANIPDPDDQSVSRYDRREYESTGHPFREITMTAVCGGSGASEENRSFAEATPSGTITFSLNNPAVADHFKPGQAYYVEFRPVE